MFRPATAFVLFLVKYVLPSALCCMFLGIALERWALRSPINRPESLLVLSLIALLWGMVLGIFIHSLWFIMSLWFVGDGRLRRFDLLLKGLVVVLILLEDLGSKQGINLATTMFYLGTGAGLYLPWLRQKSSMAGVAQALGKTVAA